MQQTNNPNELGKYIKSFIKDKWKNQKRAAKFLDTTESTLSKIINGDVEPSLTFRKKMVKAGFDRTYFDIYDELQNINVNLTTKEELIELVMHYKFLTIQQRDLISFLSKRLRMREEIS